MVALLLIGGALPLYAREQFEINGYESEDVIDDQSYNGKQEWWQQRHPGGWARYQMGAQPTPEPSFSDISEQPYISGFEQGIYNSPK